MYLVKKTDAHLHVSDDRLHHFVVRDHFDEIFFTRGAVLVKKKANIHIKIQTHTHRNILRS